MKKINAFILFGRAFKNARNDYGKHDVSIIPYVVC